jgi:hypothetical protein
VIYTIVKNKLLIAAVCSRLFLFFLQATLNLMGAALQGSFPSMLPRLTNLGKVVWLRYASVAAALTRYLVLVALYQRP